MGLKESLIFVKNYLGSRNVSTISFAKRDTSLDFLKVFSPLPSISCSILICVSSMMMMTVTVTVTMTVMVMTVTVTVIIVTKSVNMTVVMEI